MAETNVVKQGNIKMYECQYEDCKAKFKPFIFSNRVQTKFCPHHTRIVHSDKTREGIKRNKSNVIQLDFTNHPNLLQSLTNLSQSEFRTLDQQIFYILTRHIEDKKDGQDKAWSL